MANRTRKLLRAARITRERAEAAQSQARVNRPEDQLGVQAEEEFFDAEERMDPVAVEVPAIQVNPAPEDDEEFLDAEERMDPVAVEVPAIQANLAPEDDEEFLDAEEPMPVLRQMDCGLDTLLDYKVARRRGAPEAQGSLNAYVAKTLHLDHEVQVCLRGDGRDVDLDEVDLSGSIVENIASRRGMKNVNFEGATLRACDFRGSIRGMNAKGSRWDNVTMNNATIDQCDMSNGYYANSIFQKCTIKNTSLSESQLLNTLIKESAITGCNLASLTLSQSEVVQSSMDTVDLHSTFMNNSQWSNVKLSRANLSNVRSNRCSFNKVSIANSRHEGSELLPLGEDDGFEHINKREPLQMHEELFNREGLVDIMRQDQENQVSAIRGVRGFESSSWWEKTQVGASALWSHFRGKTADVQGAAGAAGGAIAGGMAGLGASGMVAGVVAGGVATNLPALVDAPGAVKKALNSYNREKHEGKSPEEARNAVIKSARRDAEIVREEKINGYYDVVMKWVKPILTSLAVGLSVLFVVNVASFGLILGPALAITSGIVSGYYSYRHYDKIAKLTENVIGSSDTKSREVLGHTSDETDPSVAVERTRNSPPTIAYKRGEGDGLFYQRNGEEPTERVNQPILTRLSDKISALFSRRAEREVALRDRREQVRNIDHDGPAL